MQSITFAPLIFGLAEFSNLRELIFRHRPRSDVKTPSDSVFEAAVHKQRNAIQHLSALTRVEPNFLASESFPCL